MTADDEAEMAEAIQEVAEYLFNGHVDGDLTLDEIKAELWAQRRAAAEAEREACAFIADDMGSIEAAEIIRQRGKR